MDVGELFEKWEDWLERIYAEQLQDLLINQNIWHQLQEAFRRQAGKNIYLGGDLAKWMQQGYVAFACTAIRRIVEEPKKGCNSISLVIFLEELKEHCSLFTRDRFHEMYYGELPQEYSVRDFNSIARQEGAKQLTESRIDEDIVSLIDVAKPVKKLVNKVIAHTEEDKSKIPKVKYRELDVAIDQLRDTYNLYYRLINGVTIEPILEDVRDDIAKIWP